MSRNLWDKLPQETTKAYLMFCQYRDMGLNRSLRKLVQKLDKNDTYLGQLGTWSSKYNWPERVEAYDFYLVEQERIAFEDQLINRRLEHRKDELEMSKQLFAYCHKVMDQVDQASIISEEHTNNFAHQLAVKIPKVVETASKIGRRALNMPLEAQPTESTGNQLDAIADALRNIEDDEPK